MKNQMTNKFYLIVTAFIIAQSNFVFADDLNPPSYRGNPLSVYAHWNDTTGLQNPDWSWVEDSDPSTYLYPGSPSLSLMSGTTNVYTLIVPNFIDEMPLKLLRLQLTWVGTTSPPVSISGLGFDGSDVSNGIVTFASTPLVFTQPDGGYQYFDMEFRPNPDLERLDFIIAPGAELVQVVFDSISIPEPTSIAMLVFGGLALLHKRKAAIR